MDNTNDLKKRKQLIEILGINIPPIRCSTHIKNYLKNDELECEMQNLKSEREQLISDKVEEATSEEDKNKNEKINKSLSVINDKIKAIDNQTIHSRIEASIAIASICNNFIEQLIKFVLTELISNNKKSFNISSIVNTDHKDNLYFLIIKRLPSYVNYDSKKYEENKKKQQEMTKKNKKEKQNNENENVEADVENNKDTDAENDVENDTDINKENNKIYFNSYVTEIYKSCMYSMINKDDKKEIIRIDKDAKTFLSNLIVECIIHFISLAKIIVKDVSKVKTITSVHLKTIMNICLKNDGRSDEEISEINNIIDEKISLYNKRIKSNKTKSDEIVDEIEKVDNNNIDAEEKPVHTKKNKSKKSKNNHINEIVEALAEN